MDRAFPVTNDTLDATGKALPGPKYRLRSINQIANPHPLYRVCIIYASSKTEIR
jgi:hypothetical protein